MGMHRTFSIHDLTLRSGHGILDAIEAVAKDELEIKEIAMHQQMPSKTVLGDVYVMFGTPVDQLAVQPDKLASLTDEIKARGYILDQSTVLRMLFNTRKNGGLPRLGRQARS